jgi:hypothetical protein
MSYIPFQRRIDQVLSTQGDGSGANDLAADGISITGATTASPVVVTSATHGLSVGDWVFIDGATGTTEINGVRQINTVPSGTTFTLKDEAGDVVNSAGTFGGTVDMNIALVVKPAATERFQLSRLNGWGADDAAIDIDGFLGITALTNGINVKVYDGATGTLQSLLPKPITSWFDWGLATGGVDATGDTTANKVWGGFRWTFNRNAEGGIGNSDISLKGANGDFLIIYTQDDLDAINLLRFAVQGTRS